MTVDRDENAAPHSEPADQPTPSLPNPPFLSLSLNQVGTKFATAHPDVNAKAHA